MMLGKIKGDPITKSGKIKDIDTMPGRNRRKMDAKLEETKGDLITMPRKIRDPIWASTEEEWNPDEYPRKVQVSTGEGFGQVLKNCGIQASTGEGSGRVPETGRIRASTGDWFGRVLENGEI